MTGTILERIVETKRREVAEAKRARPVAELGASIREAAPPRDFYGTVVRRGGDIALIAEIKKASPSAGVIRPDFDPVAIARTYAACGAAALSVLTDRTFFSGALSFIGAAKGAVSPPVLRKDFIIDAYQVFESRAAGADAILLIAEILPAARVRAYCELACRLGMSSLIEIHDAGRLDDIRDLIGPARRALLGINNRDLRTQTTDLRTTERVAGQLGPGVAFVSESGIKTREDVLRLQSAGATALLIGETFMRAGDIGAKVRALTGRDRGSPLDT